MVRDVGNSCQLLIMAWKSGQLLDIVLVLDESPQLRFLLLVLLVQPPVPLLGQAAH